MALDVSLEVTSGYGNSLAQNLLGKGHDVREEPTERLGWPDVLYIAAATLTTIDVIASWIAAVRQEGRELTVVLRLPDGTKLDLSKTEPEEAKLVLSKQMESAASNEEGDC